MGGVVSSVTDALGGNSRPNVNRNAARDFRPVDISAGGLNARFNDSGNRVKISSAGRRQQLVGGIQDLFRSQADELQNLRGQVEPGFGRLTDARVNAIENRRRSAVGNLRENLSRRRVLGSSFAQDALARAESEFGQQEAETRAQSFLQELDVTRDLIGREFQARQNAVQTALNELNLQAEVGTQLATQATSALQANAAVQTEAALENQRQTLGLVGAAIGGSSEAFGGGGSSGAAGATQGFSQGSMLATPPILI